MKTKNFLIAFILAVAVAIVCPVLAACNLLQENTAVYEFESLTFDGQSSMVPSEAQSVYNLYYSGSLAYFKDGRFCLELSSGQVTKMAYTKEGDKYLLSGSGIEFPMESGQVNVRAESYVTYDKSSLQIVSTNYVNDSVMMVMIYNYTVQQV